MYKTQALDDDDDAGVRMDWIGLFSYADGLYTYIYVHYCLREKHSHITQIKPQMQDNTKRITYKYNVTLQDMINL